MEESELRAYVLTAVASHASKEMRRRSRKPAQPLEVAPERSTVDGNAALPDELAIGSETRGVARDLLTSLPVRRRAVMLLRYGWGLSPKEVCALVPGLSPRAYRKEITRGVEDLIAALGKVESGEWCEDRERLIRDLVAGTADRVIATTGDRAPQSLPGMLGARHPPVAAAPRGRKPDRALERRRLHRRRPAAAATRSARPSVESRRRRSTPPRRRSRRATTLLASGGAKGIRCGGSRSRCEAGRCRYGDQGRRRLRRCRRRCDGVRRGGGRARDLPCRTSIRSSSVVRLAAIARPSSGELRKPRVAIASVVRVSRAVDAEGTSSHPQGPRIRRLQHPPPTPAPEAPPVEEPASPPPVQEFDPVAASAPAPSPAAGAERLERRVGRLDRRERVWTMSDPRPLCGRDWRRPR